MRITRVNEKYIRGRNDLTVKNTRQNGVRFTNLEYEEQSKMYADYTTEYTRAQAKVEKQVLEIAAGYSEPFENLSDLLAELDVLVSFAHVAYTQQYVRPTMLPMGSGTIELTNSKHPCLLAIDSSTVIGNDVQLRTGESNVQIITGPNMGKLH